MKHPIRIGVLVNRDRQQTLTSWEPTATYLTQELQGHCFSIVPLDFSEIRQAVASNAVEFLIANPGIYVEFEALYGVNRLATLKKRRFGKPHTLFGSVIFTRDRRLSALGDLKGKRVIAVAEASLGGWRMAWREFVEAGIDPYRDFQQLRFGQSHDGVIHAIQNGEADAGVVSTNVLEQLDIEGQVNLKTLTIIHPQTQYQESFPFVLSTRLYPEWPFAAAQQTPSDLSEQVAIALLKFSADHPAAIAANSMGWTIPLNYQPVHECFQVLRVDPYKNFGKTTSSFELAVKGSNDGLWDWNLETNEVFFSPRWKEMLGFATTELPNQIESWHDRLHPADRDYVLSSLQQLFMGEESGCELEYRLLHRHGNYRWVLCRATLLRDVWKKPYRMAGSHTDITNRKHAEEELRQSEQQLKQQTEQLQQTLKELQETQLQLIHSEKMSVLCQLVGGIAH
ncbi:MAG: PhnD/SsuA/transferrin family substrate-binding protein [Leptolyngbyaceae cyanobacterium bins.302]|nr:PhnD/SsuA/transferrin family substrate-binding protein [Leptolyngbyaceae cyanobacterium bins.302]